MNVLSAAPIVFLCLFLFLPPVSGLAFPSQPGARSTAGVVRAPVVVVLFDELPLTSLLDDHGRVDPVRYPAFAELARTGTWFRNAYAVYDSTEHAQPSIMDGNYPAKGELPIASDHPNSIFTLLGKTHRMNVSEEATAVCPRSLCEDPRLAPAVRRTHEVDGRGPRPRVAAHGVAAGDREAAGVGVRQLGQLRRRSERAQQRHRAREPRRQPQGPLRRLGPEGHARDWSAAQPQAHAPPARAVAVPARREAVPRRRRPLPGLVEPVLQRRHAGGVPLPAPPAPARLR